MLTTILFYLFSTVLLGSAIAVIAAKNPVHSVLFLILAFFNAAGLFLLQGAEFAAFILVIVYVGAVAVLFLFVVMMLDINFKDLRQGVKKVLPVGLLVGGILAVQLVLSVINMNATAAAAVPGVDNVHAIGRVLYTDYVYPFQVAGLILMVAMIGAIALTLRHRGGVRKQRIAGQITRKRSESIAIRKVEKGSGI